MAAIRPYLLINRNHFQYNISRHWEEFTCKVLTNSSFCKTQDALKWKIKDGIWRPYLLMDQTHFRVTQTSHRPLDATDSNSFMGEHIYLTSNHNCLKKISYRGTKTITKVEIIQNIGSLPQGRHINSTWAPYGGMWPYCTYPNSCLNQGTYQPNKLNHSRK